MKKYTKTLAIIISLFMLLIMATALPVNAASKNMSTTSVYVNSHVVLKKPVSSRNFKWKAINNKYYSLTSAGKVTGKKAGTATLTVSYRNVKYSYKIVVKNKPNVAIAYAASVTTKNMPSASVYVGGSKTLTKPSVTGFKWKAVNNTYYSVTTTGKVTGKKAGTASFSITYKNIKYVYKITVKNKPKLNYTSKTVVVGDRVNLNVIGGSSNVTWNIGNEKIVRESITSSSSFRGSAFNVGTTTVTAKTAGFTLTCKVTVKPYSGSLVKKMAPKADAKLTSAFDTLGFKLKYETSLPGGGRGGYFSGRDASITLTEMHLNDDLDDTIYHELGHFLAFIAGNADKNESFKAIYESEKGLFVGANKSYATQNSVEYFADSYREYILEPSRLKKQRPKTYKAMQDALSKVTDARIEKIKQVYGPFWK